MEGQAPGSPAETGGRLQIAAAVIPDVTGERVLLARRPDHVPHGGLWEFPGGKQEPGESIQQALSRELREELDITPAAARPFLRVVHDYGHVVVELHVWYVAAWEGTPRGVEGQVLEWVATCDLGSREFPAANHPVIAALQLPDQVVITPDLARYDGRFMDAAGQLLASGVRELHFRSQRADPGERTRTIAALARLCAGSGARFVVNGTVEEVLGSGAGGLHLGARRLMALRERPLSTGFSVSASCHDAAELAQAESLGLDYVFLGPVHETASHAGAAVLGWEGVRGLLGRGLRVPVYALGGMTRAHLPQARAAGARGVAMISAAWPAGAGS